MVRRALRVVLFASFVIVFWTMARPAYAYAAHASAAPLCDDRGATSLAPPPALEAPDVAIQRARAASCTCGDELALFVTITAVHHGVAPPSADSAQALPASSLHLAPLVGDDLDDSVDAGRPLDGIRSRVDRPPRA
jgi:hypothetical protein